MVSAFGRCLALDECGGQQGGLEGHGENGARGGAALGYAGGSGLGTDRPGWLRDVRLVPGAVYFPFPKNTRAKGGCLKRTETHAGVSSAWSQAVGFSPAASAAG